MNKKFDYRGQTFDGLFAYLRKKSLIDSVGILRDSFVTVKINAYCLATGYYGSDVGVLIDGNEKSSWINKDGEGRTYLIIDLKMINFLVSGMIFYTSCNVPEQLMIEGSQDNSQYEFLTNQTDLKDYSPNYFNIKAKKPYRYIRIRQISSINSVRFHASELELFGTLNPSMCSNNNRHQRNCGIISKIFSAY